MTDSSRDAILLAARKAFARLPYASVTLRGIAADAGVSASLIVKHFGGKESLFTTVADFTEAATALLDAPDAELGRHMVCVLVRSRRASNSDPLLRVVFAIGPGDERAFMRERFRTQVVQAIAARLCGQDKAVRAELVAAHLLGLGAALAVDRTGPLAKAPVEKVADLYAPGVQALIH
ncbi:TetR family transcriptional regulator [Actinokineospora sp. NBRC 105648]|uniref:TetR/AcrR family transcriptional regulator n=1 Tax=Actinokineospora sp. NBRC 105648 TaxID=3032206 RepID=UPI0024A44736|nr:TetR family transcriptional regulator [Actinokineospora sp. NBRC 105648]GLZ39054.1 TetR family transcriptional regulator [Actinokineospora sp. NBRC 105648]